MFGLSLEQQPGQNEGNCNTQHYGSVSLY
jgi:hypothetical protein